MLLSCWESSILLVFVRRFDVTRSVGVAFCLFRQSVCAFCSQEASPATSRNLLLPSLWIGLVFSSA